MITVAIPFCRESPDVFKDAVRSVFAQTRSDWRLILIGDGPSPELLRAASEIRDDRVEVRGDNRSRGLASRLNESIALTDTEFYLRMDADDIMFRDRLERQSRVLESSEDIDVVGSRAVVINESNKPEGVLREKSEMGVVVDDYLKSNAFTHPAVAGRTSWFKRHRYDERIGRAEDKELWIRTAAVSSFVKLGDPSLYYRVPSTFNRPKAFRTAADDAWVAYAARAHGATRRAVGRAVIGALTKAAVYGALPSASWPGVRARRIEPAPNGVSAAWAAEIESICRTAVPGWR